MAVGIPTSPEGQVDLQRGETLPRDAHRKYQRLQPPVVANQQWLEPQPFLGSLPKRKGALGEAHSSRPRHLHPDATGFSGREFLQTLDGRYARVMERKARQAALRAAAQLGKDAQADVRPEGVSERALLGRTKDSLHVPAPYTITADTIYLSDLEFAQLKADHPSKPSRRLQPASTRTASDFVKSKSHDALGRCPWTNGGRARCQWANCRWHKTPISGTGKSQESKAC